MNRDVCEHFNPIDLPCDRCGKRTRPDDLHTCSPRAIYLAEILQSEPGAVADAAAAELRRLHDENERLTKLCYDYIGELTAMRAAKQMQDRIDKMKARNNA
jgi:hypothetical protein